MPAAFVFPALEVLPVVFASVALSPGFVLVETAVLQVVDCPGLAVPLPEKSVRVTPTFLILGFVPVVELVLALPGLP